MLFPKMAKLAGTLLMVGGLAACVDIVTNFRVVDENSGLVTTSIIMDREFYDMSQSQGGDSFCKDGGELNVTDTAATCTTVEEGTFAQLLEGAQPGEPAPTITSAGPGLVRVAFPTAALLEQAGKGGADPETLAMMQQFFEGKNLTLKISGGNITESNMEIAGDGLSASFVIPLLGLVSGELELPEESFAVVSLN